MTAGPTIPRPLALRAQVAAHRRSLTRELSEGATPASSPELTLRAEQLTSDHKRRVLARSLRRTIHEALHPAPGASGSRSSGAAR